MNQSDDDAHRFFVRRLNESMGAVEFIAEYLKARGHNVRILEHKVTPDYEHRIEHVDSGDLETYNAFCISEEYQRYLELYQRHEVKGLLKVKFSSRNDFPYKDLIVCRKHSYDFADPKPQCYFVLSADRKGMAVIGVASTVDAWYVKRMWDVDYQNYEEKYMVRADHPGIYWITFEELIS